VDFQSGLIGMVVPWLENPDWKYAKVGKQIAAHDFCKWLPCVERLFRCWYHASFVCIAKKKGAALANSIRRYWIPATLILILSFTFFARVIPALHMVFPEPGEVRLLGADAYYHLRHATFAVEHFPHLQRSDHGTHYPIGAYVSSAGLFDLLIAAVALLIGLGNPSATLIAQVAAWLPPILGTLTVLTTFLLTKSITSPRVALLACALLTLYPGRFLNRSMLGFADHHVAEVLLVLIILYGLARYLKYGIRQGLLWWHPAWLYALPLTLLYFTWVGAPIYLVLIVLTFLALAIIQVVLGLHSWLLVKASVNYGAGFLVTLIPFSLIWPDLIMRQDALFLSIATAIVVLMIGLPALLWVGFKIIERGLPNIIAGLTLLFILGLCFTLALTILPESDALIHALIDAKIPLIAEHDVVTFPLIWERAGVSGLIAMLALPLVLFNLLNTRKTPAKTRQSERFHHQLELMPIFMALLIIGLWWKTGDYAYMVAPMIALLSAWVSMRLLLLFSRSDWSSRFIGVKKEKQALGITCTSILLIAYSMAMVIPVWPLSKTAAPLPDRSLVKKSLLINEGWVEALRWMNANTPKPTLPINARVNWQQHDFTYPVGTYGVMAAWDFGSFIAAIGKRTPAFSGGINQFTTTWLLITDEEKSITLLQSKCEPDEMFRYIAIDTRSVGNNFLTNALASGHQLSEYIQPFTIQQDHGPELQMMEFNQQYTHSMAGRLYLENANELSHYRLIYQSLHKSFLTYRVDKHANESIVIRRVAYPIDTSDIEDKFVAMANRKTLLKNEEGTFYGGKIYPSVKLFEVVQGARLTGKAPPGSLIRAELNLHVNSTNKSIQYQKSVRTNHAGDFELIVPYATDHMNGSAIQADGYFLLYQADGNFLQKDFSRIHVTDDQVRNGLSIQVQLSL